MIQNRLDVNQIKSDIFRARFYDEIRKGDPEWADYSIKHDEIHLPEKTSVRVYGSPAYKDIIEVAAGLDDPAEPMEEAKKIKVPPVAWIVERIKYYKALEEKRLAS